jgi:hypothetical protein
MRWLAWLAVFGGVASADTFALVKRDARLHEEANDASPSVIPGGSGQRVFRVLADEGEWITVETMPNVDERHCEGDTDFLSLAIRLHVRREGLAPVLARRVQLPLRGGTSVTLHPGLPLVDSAQLDADGRRIFTTKQLPNVRLPLTPDAVAAAYEPEPVEKSRQIEMLSRSANLSLDGARLDLGTLLGSQMRFDEGIAVQRRVVKKDGTFVTVRAGCIDAEARALLELPLRHRSYGILGALSGFNGYDSPDRVHAGARLHWLGGAEAGRVVADITLGRRVEASDTGALVCYEMIIGRSVFSVGVQPRLTLCVAPGDVIKPKSR